jgi:hypothetical protein
VENDTPICLFAAISDMICEVGVQVERVARLVLDLRLV